MLMHPVIVLFKATGNTPILKQNKFKISAGQRFQYLIDFLRRQLKLCSDEQLFLYVNSAFAPAPDEALESLFRCFNSDNMLVINYCLNVAWG